MVFIVCMMRMVFGGIRAEPCRSIIGSLAPLQERRTAAKKPEFASSPFVEKLFGIMPPGQKCVSTPTPWGRAPALFQPFRGFGREVERRVNPFAALKNA